MPRYINPGDYVFGDFPEGVRTLLGSCVSIVLWHPARRLLGVTHILLPEGPKSISKTAERCGYYADCAIRRLQDDMRARETEALEYVMALYGGSRLLLHHGEVSKFLSVGERNVEFVQARAEALGWRFQHVDTGGPLPRRLTVNGVTGEVSVQFIRARALEV